MAAWFPDAAPDTRGGDTLCLPETTHSFLRRMTRDWHGRVDDAYARHDLAGRAGLAGFLVRQAAALLPLERLIESCGAAAMLPDWDARRRRAAILADLAHLGIDPPAPAALPPFPSRLHGFGALYVLEGSRLGARMLLRGVAASPDPDVRAATRYLGHPNTGGWQRFLAILNDLPPDAEMRAALHAGAVAAFAAFLPNADDPAMPSGARAPALSISVKHETARTLGEHAA